jgi:hypothetical protein
MSLLSALCEYVFNCEFIDTYILELSCRIVRTQYLINLENNKALR